MTDIRQTLHDHKPTPTSLELGLPDPPPVRTVSGEGYDRCPIDGCCTVDAVHQHGGTTLRSKEEYHNWWMYSADPRKGGCGAVWTRTTQQGEEHNTSKGVRTGMRTTSNDLGRVYSLPSRAYSNNYQNIDWSK